ncbi:hypothetical protein ACWDLL_26245 [Streptomyces griseoincarnatus]|nr:hypothetical protein [Actinospica acidiphila]
MGVACQQPPEAAGALVPIRSVARGAGADPQRGRGRAAAAALVALRGAGLVEQAGAAAHTGLLLLHDGAPFGS